MTTPLVILQKNHAGKNYSSSPNQEEESSKKKNDQRKNVQQFMRIEGKQSVHNMNDNMKDYGTLCINDISA